MSSMDPVHIIFYSCDSYGRTLLDKVMLTLLVNKFSSFMEAEESLLFSQQSASGPYLETTGSSPHPVCCKIHGYRLHVNRAPFNNDSHLASQEILVYFRT
jgi:hypothetical protein